MNFNSPCVLSIFLGFLFFKISPKSYRWQKTQKTAAPQQAQYVQQAQETTAPQVSLSKESRVGSLSTKVITTK
jgi:sortase (surface protein transpeptidase)